MSTNKENLVVHRLQFGNFYGITHGINISSNVYENRDMLVACLFSCQTLQFHQFPSHNSNYISQATIGRETSVIAQQRR